MSTIEKVGLTKAISLLSMNEGIFNGSLLKTQDEKELEKSDKS